MNLWDKILSASTLPECSSIASHLCNTVGGKVFFSGLYSIEYLGELTFELSYLGQEEINIIYNEENEYEILYIEKEYYNIVYLGEKIIDIDYER